MRLTHTKLGFGSPRKQKNVITGGPSIGYNYPDEVEVCSPLQQLPASWNLS